MRRFAARVEASPIGLRLARGAFWSLAGALIARGSTFVAGFFLARILGKESFGKLAMAQSTLDMVANFAGFGMSMTATKYVAEFRAHAPQRLGSLIGMALLTTSIMGALASGLLFLFAPWLAIQKLTSSDLGGLLRIGAACVFLTAVNGALTGALAGFEAFRTIARVNLSAGVLTLPLILAGVSWRQLEGTVWALCACQLVLCVFNVLALFSVCRREGVQINWPNRGGNWRIIWQFSLPALLSTSLVGPVNWACNAMLANQPNGYSQLGIFTAANLWFSLMLFLPSISSLALLPILAGRATSADRKGEYAARKIVFMAMRVTALAVVPLTLGICIFSPSIMGLYGSSFSVGWKTLCFAALGACIAALQMPAGNMVVAARSMWLVSVVSALWGGTYYGLAYFWVERGSDGLSLARAAAYAVNLAATLLLMNFYAGKRPEKVPI